MRAQRLVGLEAREAEILQQLSGSTHTLVSRCRRRLLLHVNVLAHVDGQRGRIVRIHRREEEVQPRPVHDVRLPRRAERLGACRSPSSASASSPSRRSTPCRRTCTRRPCARRRRTIGPTRTARRRAPRRRRRRRGAASTARRASRCRRRRRRCDGAHRRVVGAAHRVDPAVEHRRARRRDVGRHRRRRADDDVALRARRRERDHVGTRVVAVVELAAQHVDLLLEADADGVGARARQVLAARVVVRVAKRGSSAYEYASHVF